MTRRIDPETLRVIATLVVLVLVVVAFVAPDALIRLGRGDPMR